MTLQVVALCKCWRRCNQDSLLCSSCMACRSRCAGAGVGLHLADCPVNSSTVCCVRPKASAAAKATLPQAGLSDISCHQAHRDRLRQRCSYRAFSKSQLVILCMKPPRCVQDPEEAAQQHYRQQGCLLCSFLHVSFDTLCCLQGLRGSQHSRSAPAGGEQRLKSRQPRPARARQGQRPALLLRRTPPPVGSLMLGSKPQAAPGSPV